MWRKTWRNECDVGTNVSNVFHKEMRWLQIGAAWTIHKAFET